MELDTNNYGWAHDAFVALNDADSQRQPTPGKWPSFSQSNQAFPPSAFTIPPTLINHASVERYGQITPPDELSPAAVHSETAREGSIPVEQLHNEVPWPIEQQVRDLANYKPSPQQQQNSSQPEETPGRSSNRRRPAKQAPANQNLASSNTQQTPASDQQPPKRKRGRPKSQPQVVEAFTADGYPFQVSSARQSHLEKNRVAAHKCRQRKKEYVNSLEARAREYSGKNKALKENVALLREEVLELKNEVLRHAGCGFWAVDEYLARCAGDLLGIESPHLSLSRKNSHQNHQSQLQSPASAAYDTVENERETSIISAASQISDDSHEQLDEFAGLDLIELDDDMECSND